MTDSQIFEKLFNGGNFALPYLIKFTHTEAGVIRLVDNNEDIIYNGETYKAATFDYIPPDNTGNGGSLNFDATPENSDLFEFIETADDNIKLEVVGIIAENNEVARIKNYRHFHGTISIDENGAAEFTLNGDDRPDMTFPPYTYDTETNPGNA